jgi:hypothetical protein
MKQLIQMKLNESTIQKVEELKKIMSEENRTQLVSEGISLYLEIAKAVKSGAKILIENKDGSKERLIFNR